MKIISGSTVDSHKRSNNNSETAEDEKNGFLDTLLTKMSTKRKTVRGNKTHFPE